MTATLAEHLSQLLKILAESTQRGRRTGYKSGRREEMGVERENLYPFSGPIRRVKKKAGSLDRTAFKNKFWKIH